MWQKMVSSCPFMKENDAHYLEQFAPEVRIIHINAVNFKPHFIDLFSSLCRKNTTRLRL